MAFLTPYQRYRLLEIFPGLLMWSAFIVGVTLSFVQPVWVVYFIIVFDVYWVFRILYFSFFLLWGWKRFRVTTHTNWRATLSAVPRSERIYHLVFLPTYREPYSVLEATFNSLRAANYPKEKMIVILSGEERDAVNFRQVAARIKNIFGKSFLDILVVEHPAGLPGEIPGKGSNLQYAGMHAQSRIDALGVPYEDVIVSAFDVDTIVHPEYFSYLTYVYCTHPNPTRSSYQPVAFYNNNLWDSPFFIRIMAFGTTFWLLTELARPDRLFTFSSHSMPFKALVDVGFWQKNIVSEDSRIFLQCFIHYDGDYEVTPLYIPVSMDTVRDDTLWKSLKNVYIQQRRWAWGVENIPYMIWHFRRNPRIPFFKKTKHLFNQIEGMFSWPTAAIFILILGRLPLWVARGDVEQAALFQNTPFTLEMLMTIAMIGIIISLILSLLLLPPRPKKYHHYRLLGMIVQWLFVPLTMIVVSALPAIDAQTRLMLGKYLGFTVSKKKRGQEHHSLSWNSSIYPS